MDADTPITLAAGRYTTREGAVEDFHVVWDARGENQFDHMALAVLTKDENGELQVERHDSTAKHLAWGGAFLGAALVLVAPPAGAGLLATAGAGAGAGALVGHFHHNIPKKFVEEAGDLLASGESGLLVVAVNPQNTDIRPLMENATKASVFETTWGDLDTKIQEEMAKAKAAREPSPA